MIKQFILPKPAFPRQSFVDPISPLGFDRMHDWGNRKQACFVSQGREDG
jgi:hypothetical protein